MTTFEGYTCISGYGYAVGVRLGLSIVLVKVICI